MNSAKIPSKPNILFVTSALYLGGTQKVTYILASSLSNRYNVTVAYCYDSGKSYVFGDYCNIRKLPNYDISASLLEKAACIRKQIHALKALKTELKIEVAISLGKESNFINAMSKGNENVICCERSNPGKSWGMLSFLTNLSYHKADYIIFQSQKIRDMFGSKIRQKSCILKNPVIIPTPALDKRNKKIVALGRLSAQKNHSLLIRSFARFHRQFPEYRLYIFGDGELRAPLYKLIDSLQLSGSVYLEGNDPDVHSRIRDAEMFVLSSDFEGLSNALLECMAMGIACISTKCEGSVDVIRHGSNGLLAEIGDEISLSQAMCTLAQDPILRMKLERQAAEDIKAYDKNVVIKDWERVILQILARDLPCSGTEQK